MYCNKKLSDAANSKEKEKASESVGGASIPINEGIDFLAEDIQDRE